MFDSMLNMSITTAAIGAGLMAGVYFAFSDFIMQSFDELDAPKATEAMNTINVVILRSWFMAVFFGTSLLFAILGLIAAFDSDLPGRWILFSAGFIYVVGMFLCTACFNVPLNNRLAAVVDDGNVAAEWALYYRQWKQWNHVRSICSLATLMLSLYYLVEFA